MTHALPKEVERRALARATRRAKLKGYGLITLYLVLMGGLVYWSDGSVWIMLCWTSGFLVAARYLKASRVLERGGPREHLDAETRKLLEQIEGEAIRAGQREITAGSLSVSSEPTRGELSVTEPVEGHLALTDREG